MVSLSEFAGDLASRRMLAYAEAMPMGRKLFVMRGLGRVAPCIYADSDILCFPAAAALRESSLWNASEPRYLLDPYPSLDSRLIRDDAERRDPVNGGFVLLKAPCDWDLPLSRFEALDGPPAFFSEQTLNHLAVRSSGGVPLDPMRFVLRNEDQWWANDHFSGPEVALRHYISSIRHKMWLRVNPRLGSTNGR